MATSTALAGKQASAGASRTITITATDSSAQEPAVLHVRLQRPPERRMRAKKIAAGNLNVEWKDDVVDNEHMNKKKSKSKVAPHTSRLPRRSRLVARLGPPFISPLTPPPLPPSSAECCIFKKKREFDESSDESDWAEREGEQYGVQPRGARHRDGACPHHEHEHAGEDHGSGKAAGGGKGAAAGGASKGGSGGTAGGDGG